MDEHDGPVEGEDVEAHGVKEVVTTGLSAAALLAASGTAAAATGQSHTPEAAKPAAHTAVHKSTGADPTQKDPRGREVQKKADPAYKLNPKTSDIFRKL